MRFFIFIIYFTLPTLLFAQNEGVISIKKHDIIYRGYDNYIEIGLKEYCHDSIWLECSNCESVKLKSHQIYIVKPLDKRHTTLSILAFDGEKVFTISSKEFRVRDLPDPKIRIASFWNDTPLRISVLKAIANSKEPLFCGDPPSNKIRLIHLSALYGPEETLQADFFVNSWCVKIQNEIFQEESSKINLDLFEYLMNLKFTEPVYMKIEIEALGSDGKVRFISSVFEVVA